MYDTQIAIVKYLENIKTVNGIQTIESYTGQLAEAAQNMSRATFKKPAVLVVIDGCTEHFSGRNVPVSLIVVTDSKSFNVKLARANNLQLVQDLLDWILDNRSFEHDQNVYTILSEIENAAISAGILSITQRYTIAEINFEVKKQ